VVVKLHPIGVSEIESKLLVFEERFNMPTARFAEMFEDGQLEETDDFLDWSLLYSAWRLATHQD
jgi:hypothetical protein